MAPNFNHLRVFGSLAYVHVSKSWRSKLEAKSIKCVMVGYGDQSKTYKCFDPKGKKGVD
jgi:hypothetical protein